ncbi:hypothetical protein BV20DRAFT_1057656 [Pilatotrama ljubarskyi]|nr:hypothetical protein BV20DRAFT_1057656 [Pilatotrama ljubarskyi]
MSSPSTPTRSGRRASLAVSARAAPIRRDINLTSCRALEDFVSLGCYNGSIGRVVEDIRIALPMNEGYPAQLIRCVLRLTPNIECLVLDLPPESPVTLLNGLNFPNLRVFSTNLPHRALVTFLTAHASLTSLALRACGRGVMCPLDGLELRHLMDLQCPSRCFVGITRGPLATATVNLTRLSSMASLAIQTLAASRIHTLTVDCFSSDYDILSRVVFAVPNLRKLKINEKPQPQRRHNHARRPWNDLRAWHHTLMQLPSLEELMLRTLVPVSGPSRSEARVVNGWARGVGQHAVIHPNLFYIALIQKDTTPGSAGQLLSHWFKDHMGVWGRVSAAAIGPSHSFTL